MKKCADVFNFDQWRESNDREFKLAAGKNGCGALPNSVWETYSAMANTVGGIIFLGVKEFPDCHIEIEGVSNPEKIIKEFYSDYKVIHITETHRLDKLDAPSGTALMLKRFILSLNPNIEVMIRSVRKGDVCGIHKVTFMNESEEISIIHKANNRYIFVDGAYYAAFLMLKRGSGLYSFEGIVND